MLKPRKHLKKRFKYPTVVKKLITLEERGFLEDDHGRWYKVLYHDKLMKKTLIASGNSLYLKVEEFNNSTDTITLWDRRICGKYLDPMDFRFLISIIEEGCTPRVARTR